MSRWWKMYKQSWWVPLRMYKRLRTFSKRARMPRPSIGLLLRQVFDQKMTRNAKSPFDYLEMIWALRFMQIANFFTQLLWNLIHVGLGSWSKIISYIGPNYNSINITHRVLGGGRCRQTGMAASAGTGNTNSNQQQITVTKAECCCAMGAAWGSAENSANSTFGTSKLCLTGCIFLGSRKSYYVFSQIYRSFISQDLIFTEFASMRTKKWILVTKWWKKCSIG